MFLHNDFNIDNDQDLNNDDSDDPREIGTFLKIKSIFHTVTVKNTVISPESPETMRKLCLSTKFPHQEIR